MGQGQGESGVDGGGRGYVGRVAVDTGVGARGSTASGHGCGSWLWYVAARGPPCTRASFIYLKGLGVRLALPVALPVTAQILRIGAMRILVQGCRHTVGRLLLQSPLLRRLCTLASLFTRTRSVLAGLRVLCALASFILPARSVLEASLRGGCTPRAAP